MSLFDGCSEIVDRHLGITDAWAGKAPRYQHPTTLLRMTDGNLPSGPELVRELFGQMMQNWGVAGCPATSSKENWRFEKHTDFQDVTRSPEVPLERTIASLMDENWANQIPVDSGILGGGAKTLDLACREGDTFNLIELKVATNTPLSAAIQVLQYGLGNLFFQINCHRVLPAGSENQLLHARRLRLQVLSPVSFYERFEKVSAWLKQFETCIQRGAIEFSDQFANSEYPRIGQFCFQAFPADFTWDPSRHADEAHRQEVKDAVGQRFCYYA